MATIINGSDNFNTNDVATDTELSTHGIGYNQTWQDVTTNRNHSTTYTNTTGKPIFVSVAIRESRAEERFLGWLQVDGIKVCEVSGQGNNVHERGATLYAVVPNGSIYKYEPNEALYDVVIKWCELR